MALPGFRDFYPGDCAFRNQIFSHWRTVAQRYGFVEYDGPPLEPLDLFTKKSGAEIVGQLYNFVDKGEREVALRPEMTPTLARLVTAKHKDYRKPLKWFSLPQVFRYERQQKGRLREHYQLNCDILGEAGLEADIELIALVLDVLRSFGLQEKDIVVRLSDRQFWSDFMDKNGVAENHRYAFLQAIDKSEREPREKTAEKLEALAPGLAAKAFRVLEQGAEWETLARIEQGLKARGLDGFVKRDFTIVRGLAYYTGVVWEVFDRAGEFRAIAAGGRYDTLLKSLGGVDLSALGFGMGDVVLGEILKARAWIGTPAQPAGIYIVIPEETYRANAMKVVQTLRDTQKFSVEYPFTLQRVSKQFENAEKLQCAFALVVDAEFARGTVQVKRLATHEQTSVALENLLAFLA